MTRENGEQDETAIDRHRAANNSDNLSASTRLTYRGDSRKISAEGKGNCEPNRVRFKARLLPAFEREH